MADNPDNLPRFTSWEVSERFGMRHCRVTALIRSNMEFLDTIGPTPTFSYRVPAMGAGSPIFWLTSVQAMFLISGGRGITARLAREWLAEKVAENFTNE